MTAILAWGVVGAFGAAWFVHLFWRERGANLWVWLASIAAALFVLLGLWGVFRYLVDVAHQLSH